MNQGQIENRYQIDWAGYDFSDNSLEISGGATAVVRRDGSFACF